MRHCCFALIIIFGTLNCLAQKYVCHIEGITTDTCTTKLFVVESGADMRTQKDILEIPVVNGKFGYDLKSDIVRYYQLCADNQYYNGTWRPAVVIVENQNVKLTMGGLDDKILVEGTGKETKMMQQCEAFLDAKYDYLLDSIDLKRDSIEAILKKEIEGMNEDERRVYVDDFYGENSKNPHSVDYNKYEREYEELCDEMRITEAKWLDEHPCIYGLFRMKSSLSSYGAKDNPQTPHLISSYKNTYSKLYAGHPYHQDIKNAILSIDLIPGNKYIDYDVPNADGKTVKLSSLFTGKVIYIDLWASWCGPCRKHAKSLIPLYEKYKDKGFQIIGIAREQQEGRMESAAKKDGYPWMNLVEIGDEKYNIWLKNGVSNAGGGGFLISEDGTILAVYPEAEETEKILKERLMK